MHLPAEIFGQLYTPYIMIPVALISGYFAYYHEENPPDLKYFVEVSWSFGFITMLSLGMDTILY